MADENFDGFGADFFEDDARPAEREAAEEFGGFDGMDDATSPAVVSTSKPSPPATSDVAGAEEPLIGEVGYQDKTTGRCEPTLVEKQEKAATADFDSAEYRDPNKPPPEPPVPRLDESEDAMRNDGVTLAWDAVTGDVFIVQWRKCLSKRGEWVTSLWDNFNPTENASDDQCIIRPNNKACTGARILDLQESQGYNFRLVAGSPGGTSYSKITQPILTRDPIRGLYSSWLQMPAPRKKTLKLSIRRSTVGKRVFCVITKEDFSMYKAPDGTLLLRMKLNETKSIDTYDSTREVANSFRILGVDGRSVVLFAPNDFVRRQWTTRLRRGLRDQVAAFGTARNTALMM